MNRDQEMGKQALPKWRLLRALCLMGNPKIKPLACWLFFIPQFVIYLYLLGPVFVYYTKGVPPKESLEVISGTWREEGKLGSNRNGLIAPRYFVDTASGPRKVHCGFPMQKRFCGDSNHPLLSGMTVRIYYDDYFGILAFDYLEKSNNYEPSNLAYEQGIFDYAEAKYTIYKNYGAHIIFPLIIFMYSVIVLLCWKSTVQAKEE